MWKIICFTANFSWMSEWLMNLNEWPFGDYEHHGGLTLRCHWQEVRTVEWWRTMQQGITCSHIISHWGQLLYPSTVTLFLSMGMSCAFSSTHHQVKLFLQSSNILFIFHLFIQVPSNVHSHGHKLQLQPGNENCNLSALVHQFWISSLGIK